jgi:hypothetical protein
MRLTPEEQRRLGRRAGEGTRTNRAADFLDAGDYARLRTGDWLAADAVAGDIPCQAAPAAALGAGPGHPLRAGGTPGGPAAPGHGP